ncbi:hypothetical protein R3P38DRAFT_3503818 [Favolaschia claudopus]|uniref:Uncharacterized protein n=1 Tax=Favolaschia claudopus TaxID=2862362 RepID=A0AAW0C2T7_9AGAR
MGSTVTNSLIEFLNAPRILYFPFVGDLCWDSVDASSETELDSRRSFGFLALRAHVQRTLLHAVKSTQLSLDPAIVCDAILSDTVMAYFLAKAGVCEFLSGEIGSHYDISRALFVFVDMMLTARGREELASWFQCIFEPLVAVGVKALIRQSTDMSSVEQVAPRQGSGGTTARTTTLEVLQNLRFRQRLAMPTVFWNIEPTRPWGRIVQDTPAHFNDRCFSSLTRASASASPATPKKASFSFGPAARPTDLMINQTNNKRTVEETAHKLWPFISTTAASKPSNAPLEVNASPSQPIPPNSLPASSSPGSTLASTIVFCDPTYLHDEFSFVPVSPHQSNGDFMDCVSLSSPTEDVTSSDDHICEDSSTKSSTEVHASASPPDWAAAISFLEETAAMLNSGKITISPSRPISTSTPLTAHLRTRRRNITSSQASSSTTPRKSTSASRSKVPGGHLLLDRIFKRTAKQANILTLNARAATKFA